MKKLTFLLPIIFFACENDIQNDLGETIPNPGQIVLRTDFLTVEEAPIGGKVAAVPEGQLFMEGLVREYTCDSMWIGRPTPETYRPIPEEITFNLAENFCYGYIDFFTNADDVGSSLGTIPHFITTDVERHIYHSLTEIAKTTHYYDMVFKPLTAELEFVIETDSTQISQIDSVCYEYVYPVQFLGIGGLHNGQQSFFSTATIKGSIEISAGEDSRTHKVIPEDDELWGDFVDNYIKFTIYYNDKEPFVYFREGRRFDLKSGVKTRVIYQLDQSYNFEIKFEEGFEEVEEVPLFIAM